MTKNWTHTGIMIRLERSKDYPKEIELRKTKKFWIAKDGRKFDQTDGEAIYNPYTPVKLLIESIRSKSE